VAWQRKTAEGGQSLIEFAWMLPFLLLLFLGIVELGRAAFITMVVNNAATAGVEYGSQNEGKASDIVGMQNSALCDANGQSAGVCNTTGILTAANVTATFGCTCDTGNGGSCAPASWSSCAVIGSCEGGVMVQCVQVKTTATFNSLFNYPGLPTMFTANGNAVMRVRK
ncbi:MAG: TadE/TadG family type IV pilus assembly protein, partial [Candidatus Korobacteraceae bacterium]